MSPPPPKEVSVMSLRRAITGKDWQETPASGALRDPNVLQTRYVRKCRISKSAYNQIANRLMFKNAPSQIESTGSNYRNLPMLLSSRLQTTH